MDFVTTFQQELKLRGFIFNKEQAAEIVRALADTFLDYMWNHEDIKIPGVGRFEVTLREPRTQWSNLVQKMQYIKPLRRLKYKPYKSLIDALNNGIEEEFPNTTEE